MRVGYIFNHEFFLGGGEISLFDLIIEIRRLGVVPVAFVPAKGEVSGKLEAAGVRCVVCPWPHLNLWSILALPRRVAALARMFSDEKLELIHVNGARSMLYAGPAAKWADIPCVWHVRVLERDWILDRIRVHYATGIIANSIAVSASLEEVVGSRRRIDVIYNGFDLEAAAKSVPLDLKKEFGLPDLPIVLCPGRFTREKAFEDAIKACSVLQKRGCEVVLLLVGGSSTGDNDYEQELRSLVASKGLRNVVFSSWRRDVHSVMKSASVLLLCSRKESFGRVIVEAWASGLPVVSTNCGGPIELIKDGCNGVLVPVGAANAVADAVQGIVRDRSLADNLVEGGMRESKKFTIARHAEEVASLYSRISDAR